MRTIGRLWLLALVVGVWGTPQDDYTEEDLDSHEGAQVHTGHELQHTRKFLSSDIIKLDSNGEARCLVEGDMLYARVADQCFICACFVTQLGLSAYCAPCSHCRQHYGPGSNVPSIPSLNPGLSPERLHWPTPLLEPLNPKIWEAPSLETDWQRPFNGVEESIRPIPIPGYIPEPEWQKQSPGLVSWPIPPLRPQPVDWRAPLPPQPEVYSLPEMEPNKQIHHTPIELPRPLPGKNIYIPKWTYVPEPKEQVTRLITGRIPLQVIEVPVPVTHQARTRTPSAPQCKGQLPLVPFRIYGKHCEIHVCKIVYNYVYIETYPDPNCIYSGEGSSFPLSDAYTPDLARGNAWPTLQAGASSEANSWSFGGQADAWAKSLANAKAMPSSGVGPWTNTQAYSNAKANSIGGRGEVLANALASANTGGYSGLLNGDAWFNSQANANANVNSLVGGGDAWSNDANADASAGSLALNPGIMHRDSRSHSQATANADVNSLLGGGNVWPSNAIADANAGYYPGLLNRDPGSNSHATANAKVNSMDGWADVSSNALANAGGDSGLLNGDAWSNSQATAIAKANYKVGGYPRPLNRDPWTNFQDSAVASANSELRGNGNSWLNSEANAHVNAEIYSKLLGRSGNNDDSNYEAATSIYNKNHRDEEDPSNSIPGNYDAYANLFPLGQIMGNMDEFDK